INIRLPDVSTMATLRTSLARPRDVCIRRGNVGIRGTTAPLLPPTDEGTPRSSAPETRITHLALTRSRSRKGCCDAAARERGNLITLLRDQLSAGRAGRVDPRAHFDCAQCKSKSVPASGVAASARRAQLLN